MKFFGAIIGGTISFTFRLVVRLVLEFTKLCSLLVAILMGSKYIPLLVKGSLTFNQISIQAYAVFFGSIIVFFVLMFMTSRKRKYE